MRVVFYARIRVKIHREAADVFNQDYRRLKNLDATSDREKQLVPRIIVPTRPAQENPWQGGPQPIDQFFSF